MHTPYAHMCDRCWLHTTYISRNSGVDHHTLEAPCLVWNMCVWYEEAVVKQWHLICLYICSLFQATHKSLCQKGLIVDRSTLLHCCYNKDLHDWFYLFLHVLILESLWLMPLSFYQPLAPLFLWLMCSSLLWLRAAPYCTLLHTVTYCCSDAIVLVTPIVHVTLLF